MLYEKSLKYGVDSEFLRKDEPADIALNTHSSESIDINNSSSHPHRHHHQTVSSEALEFEKHQNATVSNTSTEYEDEAADEQHEQPEDVKSNSNRKDVTYEWMTTEWTQCSQKCGRSGGLRVSTSNLFPYKLNVPFFHPHHSTKMLLCIATIYTYTVFHLF